MHLKLIFLICFTISTGFCAPVDNIVVNKDVVDNELKGQPISVDQALNVPSKIVKVEETTTSGQLFNNEPIDEDKLFKLNNDDLIDTSYPSAKQASQGGLPNVQSLIDQTNTISLNLESMIKDMQANKRHATASMLRLMLSNVRRLNTSLVRLNSRVNSLPMPNSSTGSTSLSASSTGSSSGSSSGSSISNSISNASMNAASQINNVVNSIRNQLNSISTEINNLLLKIRQSMPGSSSGNSKPTTPSG